MEASWLLQLSQADSPASVLYIRGHICSQLQGPPLPDHTGSGDWNASLALHTELRSLLCFTPIKGTLCLFLGPFPFLPVILFPGILTLKGMGGGWRLWGGKLTAEC